MVNNEINYGLTEREIGNINMCIEAYGELYFFFGVNNDATNEEIKEAYSYYLSSFDPNETDEMKLQDWDYFKLVYKILSNPASRRYYDTELYEETRDKYMTSEDKADDRILKYLSGKSLTGLIVPGILAFAVIPIENIFKRIAAMDGIVSPVNVIKSIYKQGGIQGGMFKGSLVLFGLVPISQIFIDVPIEFILRKLLGHPKYNKIYDVIYTIQSNLTPFPIMSMYDIISMSPYAMGSIEIIKNVILRKGDGSSLQWKNLFYSLAYSTSILLARRLLLDGINLIEKRISLASTNNPNSKLLKYSQRFISNKLVLGTLSAAVCCPLDVIRFQYPNDLIKSYINHTPIPYAINPIAMAIKIINQQSIWKLYNGLSLEIPIYLYSKATGQPSIANINVYSLS